MIFPEVRKKRDVQGQFNRRSIDWKVDLAALAGLFGSALTGLIAGPWGFAELFALRSVEFGFIDGIGGVVGGCEIAANGCFFRIAGKSSFGIFTGFRISASVAQLAEQRFCKPQVVGSSPSAGS